LTGGTLIAPGTINGSLKNSGSVYFGAVIGTLSITGDYTQTGTGSLAIMIRFQEWDTVSIAGTAHLGGHLMVQGVHGTAAYDILHASGGVFGAFGDVSVPWMAVYFANDVWVQ
jgi:hypothetical protein